jgi:hypothetical protein
MEYWLVNYTTIAIDCPPSWTFFKGTSTSAPGCYMDSPYVSVPVLTASQLADVALTGSATSVDDEVTLALASGTATSVSNTDSALDLAANWDTTEWNVFGDGNGGQANFDANTSLEPVTTLTDTSVSAAPSCSELGVTAETNNLNLTNTPELGGESSPTAAFQETDDGTPVTEGLPCQTVGGTTVSGSSVCDIYSSDDTPCVAAYSMDRALYSNYDGPLYQVKRASDGTTANIGLLDTGGDVNASEQDSFCADTACTITEIYDQSSEGNNLTIEGAGGNGAADSGAAANALPITIDGNEAYGLDITPGVGYRDDSTQGMAYDDEPSGTYMVASGTNVNSGCCFDFGNAEANNDDNGDGHMDAVNLTTFCGSYDAPCSGSGPWVEADMENGQYLGGDGSNPADTGNSSDFVTAMLANNGQTTFELEGGNGQSGGLTTYWDGPLPTGYSPMDQEGAIVLGTGGDNSHSDIGSFFEGVITSNVPDQAAENAVQANIVDADYAGSSNPVSTAVASAAGQAVVHAARATGAGASGYSSVYTVNSANGDLQETYLPYMGQPWATQDLSAKYGTPAVMPGTEPVSIVHCGYTSVYTVDENHQLQETYLAAIGDAWSTQNLSANYSTPDTTTTPTAVVHIAGASGATPGCGFTSVYTVDEGSDDLQETYLPVAGFPGDAWSTQNLSANSGTPPVAPGTQPEALVHMNYTSVYTVDEGSDDLQETYLASIGDPWGTQNLSTKYGTPAVMAGTTPVSVTHDGYTSVYTIDTNGDLQETYLAAIGNAWGTQNLSTKYGTPPAYGSATALVHPDTSGGLTWTSVYTLEVNGDLQETYLPDTGFPGDSWITQNLSANYGTPAAQKGT